MINNADVDFYISFDNEKVGELQAKYLIDKVPQGNYFLMGGSPVDNNAKLFRKGQMNILKPLIDSGKIKVVGDQWVDAWLPENALKIMENVLTANNNNIQAVVASNDATAGGAIQALAAQGGDFRAGCGFGGDKTHYRWHANHDGVQTDHQAGNGSH